MLQALSARGSTLEAPGAAHSKRPGQHTRSARAARSSHVAAQLPGRDVFERAVQVAAEAGLPGLRSTPANLTENAVVTLMQSQTLYGRTVC